MTRFNGGYSYSYLSYISSNFPFRMPYLSQLQEPKFSLWFFTFSFALSFFLLSFSLYRRLTRTEQQQPSQNPKQNDPLQLEGSLSETLGKTHDTDENNSTRLSHSAHSLLLEILPSDSPKWANLFGSEGNGDPYSNGSGLDKEKEELIADQKGKKKKRKTKKKSSNSNGKDNIVERCSGDNGNLAPTSQAKQDLACLYPFTSSSSATQRKIKKQYDELMRRNESKGSTLAQVGKFVHCLVEARNELQHKADAIQRKFTITKALLFKADRSTFDRLRQQIYKLEFEQKRLEEDAFVYNWLQQHIKLSPAYKKMLEIGTCMELKAKTGELTENKDSEFSEITFEELLAQEKKDSFWQRNRKIRLCSS